MLLSEFENAKSEILAVVSSFPFLRHLVDIGLLDIMERLKNSGVDIMMIVPSVAVDHRTGGTDETNHESNEASNLVADFRNNAQIQNKNGIIMGSVFVLDNDRIITVLNDEKEIGGLTLFSNCQSLVATYTTLFESFWDEKETLRSVLHARNKLIESNAQLVEANEKLKVNDKLQKEFINIAAHELRTPIQPILGVLDLCGIFSSKVTEAEGDDEEIQIKKHYLKIIARNAARLARLSYDILDATRIESNSLKLNDKYLINLVELVSISVEDVQENAPDSTEFILNKPENPIFIEGDWDRLNQVLSNLLNNAIKFAPEGKIIVTVEKTQDNNARIIVRDNGKGIDSEIQPRLFQKFATKTDTGSGTGLGLFISKAIVEAHGGMIWAENNSNGKGAAFHFTLPM